MNKTKYNIIKQKIKQSYNIIFYKFYTYKNIFNFNTIV